MLRLYMPVSLNVGNIGWEDPEYRKCYQKILDGKWEEYDPFDATHRVDATMDMYGCGGK
jgi:hypothetical protein